MKKTKIIALDDLNIDIHHWEKGLDYELIEYANHFTITSNQSSLNYVNELKTEILNLFKKEKELFLKYISPTFKTECKGKVGNESMSLYTVDIVEIKIDNQWVNFEAYKDTIPLGIEIPTYEVIEKKNMWE